MPMGVYLPLALAACFSSWCILARALFDPPNLGPLQGSLTPRLPPAGAGALRFLWFPKASRYSARKRSATASSLLPELFANGTAGAVSSK